jgi:hypothetical protein
LSLEASNFSFLVLQPLFILKLHIELAEEASEFIAAWFVVVVES